MKKTIKKIDQSIASLNDNLRTLMSFYDNNQDLLTAAGSDVTNDYITQFAKDFEKQTQLIFHEINYHEKKSILKSGNTEDYNRWKEELLKYNKVLNQFIQKLDSELSQLNNKASQEKNPNIKKQIEAEIYNLQQFSNGLRKAVYQTLDKHQTQLTKEMLAPSEKPVINKLNKIFQKDLSGLEKMAELDHYLVELQQNNRLTNAIKNEYKKLNTFLNNQMAETITDSTAKKYKSMAKPLQDVIAVMEEENKKGPTKEKLDPKELQAMFKNAQDKALKTKDSKSLNYQFSELSDHINFIFVNQLANAKNADERALVLERMVDVAKILINKFGNMNDGINLINRVRTLLEDSLNDTTNDGILSKESREYLKKLESYNSGTPQGALKIADWQNKRVKNNLPTIPLVASYKGDLEKISEAAWVGGANLDDTIISTMKAFVKFAPTLDANENSSKEIDHTLQAQIEEPILDDKTFFKSETQAELNQNTSKKLQENKDAWKKYQEEKDKGRDLPNTFKELSENAPLDPNRIGRILAVDHLTDNVVYSLGKQLRSEKKSNIVAELENTRPINAAKSQVPAEMQAPIYRDKYTFFRTSSSNNNLKKEPDKTLTASTTSTASSSSLGSSQEKPDAILNLSSSTTSSAGSQSNFKEEDTGPKRSRSRLGRG